MHDKFYVERGDRRDTWHQTYEDNTAGVCFLVSWSKFESMLKGESVADLLPHSLRSNEYVEKFQAREDGVLVYVQKHGVARQ